MKMKIMKMKIILMILLFELVSGLNSKPALCQLPPFNEHNIYKGCNCSDPCKNFNMSSPCKAFLLCDGSDIVTLHLAGYGIISLPENIGSLKHLSQLELMYNNIRELPQNFSQLTNLYGLSLANNQLSDWNALTNLESVSLLYLNNNYFRNFPDNFGSLVRSLSLLEVSYNGISKISSSFRQLYGLSYLIMDNNELTELSPELMTLTSLVELSLASNKITILPDNFGELASLKYLNLKNNHLSALPASIISLSELTFLFLGGNQFHGEIDVSTVPSLYYLDIERMGLTEVHKSILHSPNLKIISLSGNQIYSRTDFTSMPALNIISLDSNQLTVVPTFPTSMTQISLKGNSLTTFPTEFSSFMNLTALDLSYNQLSNLPDVFHKFPNLRSLNIQNNQLESLPSTFYRLNLTHLVIDGNCFNCAEFEKEHPNSIFNTSCKQETQSKCTDKKFKKMLIPLIIGCIAVVIVLASTVVFAVFKMKKARKQLRELRRRETMLTMPLVGGHEGLVEFSGDDDEYGITVSPRELTFGTAESQVPLDKELEDHFTIIGSKNKNKKGHKFQIEAPDIPQSKCSITVQCPTDEIYAGEELVVNVKLKMLCTTSLNIPILVICNNAYTRVIVKVESQLSTLIDADEVKTGDVIGSGSFGTVYKAEWRGNTELAVKVYNNSVLQDIGLKADIEREVEMCFKLRMPFIVTFYGRTVQPDRLYIIMEYVPHGNLGSLLAKGPLDLRFKVRVALDIARGMNYLHKNRIIHRDLKSDNVLIAALHPDAVCCAKLSDFNTSRFWGSEANKTKTRGVGTPVFMAPEILDGQHYSWKADVFSFGILMWNEWTQEEPYKDFDSSMQLFKFVLEGRRLQIPADLPAELQKLTSDCWKHVPEERPSFQALFQSLGDIFQHMK